MALVSIVLDANVLYPAPLRDFFLRLSLARLFTIAWSELILDETFIAILRSRPHLQQARLDRTRRLMNTAFPNALTPPGSLQPYSLPDVNDRHVLMTAVASGSEQLVTFNLKDFPPAETLPHGVRPIHPDEFLCEQCDGNMTVMLRVLTSQLADLRRGQVSIADLLGRLERNGIPRTVALMRAETDRSAF